MTRLVLVCGRTGVGKTSYSIELAGEIGAVRFSIDPWMTTLYANDMTSLDYVWMIERVNRCYEQIWEVSAQILGLDGNVVLDLGFTEKHQRDRFADRAREQGVVPEVHFLDAPKETRRQRVKKRNLEKDSAVYSFDVTEEMFDFMEPRFERPSDAELMNGRLIERR